MYDTLTVQYYEPKCLKVGVRKKEKEKCVCHRHRLGWAYGKETGDFVGGNWTLVKGWRMGH